MSDHTFTIGTDGRIERSTFNVTQGDRPNVMFKNTRGTPVTVHVIGVPGTRAVPGHPNPSAAALFPDQGATLTVPVPTPAKPVFEARIGPSPNRGTYRLSTNPSSRPDDDSEGTIMVARITITIDMHGHLSSGNFDVTQGAELRVEFINNSNNDVTVFITGPSRTSDAGSLFRVGENPKEVEILRVPKTGAPPQPLISASARLGNFIFSTEYPPPPGPCNPWINVHRPM